MPTSVLNLAMSPFAQISNQELPTSEGPRAVPLLLDFTAFDTYVVDVSQLQQTNKFSMVQSVFVDLSGTDLALTITVRGTGQILKMKGRTQGYYPILAPSPTVLYIQCTGGPVVPMQLLNTPVFAQSWATQ